MLSGQGEIKHIKNINVGQEGISGKGSEGLFSPIFGLQRL